MKAAWAWALCLAAAAAHAHGHTRLLDGGRGDAAWTATASDQVRATLRTDRDGSRCLDYDFQGVSGYAVMRRELPVQWPRAFELAAQLKGQGGRNELQLKFVDDSGHNVWWVRRPEIAWPAALQTLRFKPRHVEFAWGPTTDRTLRHTQFLEWVVVAGRDGGRGSLCVARLVLQEREPDPASWPEPRLQRLRDGLSVDHLRSRDFNGLVLRWPAATPPGRAARRVELLASDDGRRWRLLRRLQGGRGLVDTVFLPEQQARHLRLRVAPGEAPPRVELRSAAQWPSLNAALAEQARALPRGDVPRAWLGEQNYWTLVGVDGGGDRSALISEDGAIEIGRGGYSVEPSLRLADGRGLTWADVSLHHALPQGHLPLPMVQWRHPEMHLDVQAAADGPREAPRLLARYTVHNPGPQPRELTLQLAVRPWQVNPPQQFLTTPGGARPLVRLQGRGAVQQVDAAAPMVFTRAPDRRRALPLHAGLSLRALESATASTVTDPQRHASGLLQWSLTLGAGERRSVGFAVPLAGGEPGDPVPRASAPAAPPLTEAELDARFAAVEAAWAGRLGAFTLEGGPAMRRLADTLRTALAHMLVSRDGPALRPGTRSYARTWIRDGAMMVAGLVRLGERGVAQDFVDWYAGHVFESGKVPCCVDRRGADPVVENDSHGQYLYAVAELLRHGAGPDWARRHWPLVQRVVAWQEALRQSERGERNRSPGREHLFGLMPPSISHEGYSDKPAYSYWDDFWALRGYKDAVLIARRLGHAAEAERWAAWRDEFERELSASVAAAAQAHGLGVIAGAADRGDFDPTSTTMALNPAQAALPAELLAATFERYWQEMSARSAGTRAWRAYTPYELRTVGALARLGQPVRAAAMLDFFFSHQRPQGWNQWAEVVLRDPREAEFLGDMPHAWVSSDHVRSVLDLLAWDDERTGALVIGSGWQAAWLQQADAQGRVLRVAGLHTPFGELQMQLRRVPQGWQLSVPQALPGLDPLRPGANPTGGLRLRWPEGLPLPRVRQSLPAGAAAPTWQGRELVLAAPPLQIELEP